MQHPAHAVGEGVGRTPEHEITGRGFARTRGPRTQSAPARVLAQGREHTRIGTHHVGQRVGVRGPRRPRLAHHAHTPSRRRPSHHPECHVSRLTKGCPRAPATTELAVKGDARALEHGELPTRAAPERQPGTEGGRCAAKDDMGPEQLGTACELPEGSCVRGPAQPASSQRSGALGAAHDGVDHPFSGHHERRRSDASPLSERVERAQPLDAPESRTLPARRRGSATPRAPRRHERESVGALDAAKEHRGTDAGGECMLLPQRQARACRVRGGRALEARRHVVQEHGGPPAAQEPEGLSLAHPDEGQPHQAAPRPNLRIRVPGTER